MQRHIVFALYVDAWRILCRVELRRDRRGITSGRKNQHLKRLRFPDGTQE